MFYQLVFRTALNVMKYHYVSWHFKLPVYSGSV